MKLWLAILLFSASALLAQPFTKTNWTAIVDWDKASDATVTGYILYASTNSFYSGTNQVIQSNTLARIDAGTNLTCLVSNLPLNVAVFFVVTCYNTDKIESDYSNQLDKKVTKPQPTRIKINVLLQSSLKPDGPWGDLGLIGCYDADTTGEDEFYRGILLVEKTTPQ